MLPRFAPGTLTARESDSSSGSSPKGRRFGSYPRYQSNRPESLTIPGVGSRREGRNERGDLLCEPIWSVYLDIVA